MINLGLFGSICVYSGTLKSCWAIVNRDRSLGVSEYI